MNFAIRNIRRDGALKTQWDILLKIVGEIEIVVEENIVYEESEFPVVELARQLHGWLEGGSRDVFKYKSLDSDQDCLFEFVPVEEDKWQIVSGESIGSINSLVRTEDLVVAVREYIARVSEADPASLEAIISP
jgi:hypothetical protein